MIISLLNIGEIKDKQTWHNVFEPILKGYQSDKLTELVDKIFTRSIELGCNDSDVSNIESHVDDEDESIPDICNLHFSLAYGSKILLNHSKLHLKKGFKYGIISEKSAGKTTMMRAIYQMVKLKGFLHQLMV